MGCGTRLGPPRHWRDIPDGPVERQFSDAGLVCDRDGPFFPFCVLRAAQIVGGNGLQALSHEEDLPGDEVHREKGFSSRSNG